MKKILWALALMNAMTFADVHPALKEAIDSKNYKQAENLIKNVGVKDIYCPETLAAKDADKIYGKIFADSIGYLLENCDVVFSRTYLEYKCAGGKDKTMCLNLVNLTDPNSWPETYAKQFCTKKNVEICAAAVEKIPVEKSVPYLKAIKANKLASMKEKTNAIAKEVLGCRELCEMGRKFKLSGGIDDKIFEKKQEWRRARTESDRSWIEHRINDLEKEKIAIRSENYCVKSCPGSKLSESELAKFDQYYFERAFYSLSHRASLYYKNLDNPIIPELADNWSVVDNLIDTTLIFFQKSFEDAGSKDFLNIDYGLLNIILKRQKELLELYPRVITKKFVLDTLKSSFKIGKNVKETEQLFYCKIYPSLEKETEKLFGTKILNCKVLLAENKKLFEQCHEGDSPLFDGNFQCEKTVNGWEYKRMYRQKRIGKYIVMTEQAFDAQKHECPAGWRWPNSEEMAYIKKYDPKQYVACVKNEHENEKCAEEDEGMCFDKHCCDNGKLRKGTDVELVMGKLCSASMQDSVFFVNEAVYSCEKNSFVKLGATDERFLRIFVSDSRDGKIYRKVKIGNQIWMAENLNYETNNSYCYEDNPKNCQKYGRLYKWSAAVDACPSGWHLPRKKDFGVLFYANSEKKITSKALRSQTSWNQYANGTDDFGFSALPAGAKYTDSDYRGEGESAAFWSSAEFNDFRAYYMGLYYHNDEVNLNVNDKDYALSVRCVQD